MRFHAPEISEQEESSPSLLFVFFLLMPGIFIFALCQLLSFYQNIRNVRAPDKVPKWIGIGLHPVKLPSRSLLVQQGAELQAHPGLTWFEGRSTESSTGW